MAVTIEHKSIIAESSLIDQALKEQLTGVFVKMEAPVTIKAVVDLSREKDLQMAAFLKTIVSLGERLDLELYSPDEKDQVPELDHRYLPVTGLYKEGSYGRCAFHGIPGGKEINPFVLAVYNLAGPGQKMPGGLKKKIEKLDKITNIKIFVSLSCHHCSDVVTACQQIAILNPLIEAEMFDVSLYDDLVAKYKIERIPMMIFNDNKIHMGNKSVEEIVSLLKNS